MRLRLNNELVIKFMEEQGLSRRGIMSLGVPRPVTDSLSNPTDLSLDQIYSLSRSLKCNACEILEKQSMEKLAGFLPSANVAEGPLSGAESVTTLHRFQRSESILQSYSKLRARMSGIYRSYFGDDQLLKKEWDWLARRNLYSTKVMKPSNLWQSLVGDNVLAENRDKLESLKEHLDTLLESPELEVGQTSDFAEMMDAAEKRLKGTETLKYLASHDYRVIHLELETICKLSVFFYDHMQNGDTPVGSYDYTVNPPLFNNICVIVPPDTEFLLVNSQSIVRKYVNEDLGRIEALSEQSSCPELESMGN